MLTETIASYGGLFTKDVCAISKKVHDRRVEKGYIKPKKKYEENNAELLDYSNVISESILEAKWAVFFDMIGIPWKHKPKSFLLKDGSHYTPDFYLPEAGEFFECIDSASDKTFHLLGQFMKETGKPIVLGYEGMKFRAPRLIKGNNPTFNNGCTDAGSSLGRCNNCGHLFFTNYKDADYCPSCKADLLNPGYDHDINECSWCEIGEGDGNTGISSVCYDDPTDVKKYIYVRDTEKQVHFDGGQAIKPHLNIKLMSDMTQCELRDYLGLPY